MSVCMVHWSEKEELCVFKTGSPRYHLFEGLLVSTIAFFELAFWGCSDHLRSRRDLQPRHGATGNLTYGI